MSTDLGTGKPMSRKPQLLLLLSDSILLYKSFFSGNTLTYTGAPEVGNETFLLFLFVVVVDFTRWLSFVFYDPLFFAGRREF